MSLSIDENSVVKMHYTLKNDEGEVIDSSEGDEPLAYLHGAGNIIPGLEKELSGKTVGDKLEVRVEPAEGYGEQMDELVQTLPKEAFEGIDKIEVGMAFEAQGAEGEVRQVEVVNVEGDQITIDANHPLAGVALNFAIEITEVRAATEEEIEHGHVH